MIELPPPEAPRKKTKGSHIPAAFRDLMNSFPKKVRVLSKRGVRRLICQVFLEKAENDKVHREANHEILPIAQFVSDFLYNKYGLSTLTDYHMTELIQSVRGFYKDDSRVRFFDLFVGAVHAHEDGRPVMGGAALAFVVDLYSRLSDSKQITKESLAADASAFIEISRNRALMTAKEAFSYMATPLVNNLVVRIEALPLPQSKDVR